MHDENLGEADIIGNAAQHGINLFPFSVTCVTDAPAATTLFLGTCGMTVAKVDKGINILSRMYV
jgi:hypothetical protein